jgi:MFS family permease
MKARTSDTSTFRALRNPVYRRLWLASVVSGIWVAAHDCAATWAMSRLSPSPFFLSVMSTVASLPFFLLTLPAGAFADMVDRRKLLIVMNFWLAASAGLLGLLGWFHLLSPGVILTCVFLIGVGFAFNAPAWTAITPEIVTDDELPSAATLGGLQLNISGIIGPVLGGLLIPLVTTNGVFFINALSFMIVIVAILLWRPRVRASTTPLETFFESFSSAIRYVRYAPTIQVILVRNAIFAFFISLIPALIPVVGLKELKLTPAGCGILFSAMGVGSVFGAIFVVPWLRSRRSSNALTIIANALVVVVFFLMAFVRSQPLFMIVAALAGIGWTLSASELWVAGQRAMPTWARGRMSATVIMASQGAMALGGIVWGASAAGFGVQRTLIAGAVLLALSLMLAIPLSLDFTHGLDLAPAPRTAFSHKLIHMPQPHDGPVQITYEFQADRSRGGELLEVLREVRLIHLRNGAFSWHLHEDLERPNTFRITMLMPSWTEHLLQQERMTKAERETLEKARNLHVGSEPFESRLFLSVNKELLGQRRQVISHPSTMPTSPSDMGTPEVQETT